MKRLYLISILLVLFFGCKENDYLNYFNVLNLSEKNILIGDLQLDSIILDSIETSNIGIISINDDSIVFIDYILCQVFTFDLNGIFHSRYLGHGKGPGEITAGYIESYCKLNNGNHLFISQPWDIHIFDQNWQRLHAFRIDYQVDINDIYATQNPSPEEPRLYAFEYEKFIIRSNSNNEVFLPLYSEHPNFNALSSHDYYKKGRILAQLGIEHEKITRLFGRRSPEYLNFKFAAHHSFFSYDIDANDNFHICHEIDSLIYVYCPEGILLYTYGFAGSDMNTDYQELSNFDMNELRRLYFEDRPNRGYYNEIKFINETDIMFRSYRKGGSTPYDGLQIYHKNVLIGDLEVPEGFTVTGYIPPYYYSNAFIDDINKDMSVFRFKLVGPFTMEAHLSQYINML